MYSKKTKRQFNRLFRILFILLVCGVLLYLFPKSGTFHYDYRKGMNWSYEQLVAPFDFPIYKNETELALSKKRVLEQQGLIYDYEAKIAKQNIEKVKKELDGLRGILSAKERSIIIEKLTSIYNCGIYILPENYNDKTVTAIRIIKNNISEEYLLSSLYTPKKAYQELITTINGLTISPESKQLVLQLNWALGVNPNLIYDEEKSDLSISNALKNMALTQGMVKKGDIILTPEELVTQEKIDILNSLKRSYSQQFYFDSTGIGQLIGQFMIIVIGIMIFTLYLMIQKKSSFYNIREFIFLYSLFFASIALVLAAFYQDIEIYAVPTLFFIVIVNVLINTRTALFMILGTTLISAFIVTDSFQFVVMQLTAGVIAMFSLSQLQRRSQLFVAILLIFLGYVVSFIAFELIYKGNLLPSSWVTLFWLVVNSLLLALSYLAIYLFERLFGYTSEITLMELSNPNHPALRMLTQKAPGTFQHSLMVANLAEDAIYRIGGDPLLTRTGALYHDIGKMNNPIYFIENQSGGLNPHNNHDFDESAQIIINHVREGIELAKRYNLPNSIIDFIKTHHGRSKVKFFYNSYRNKYPDREVDEKLFTYDGADPISKECAVVMMADAVEATSRSLTDKSEENIEMVVNNIIDTQVQEGRFQKAHITFNDIAAVKRIFIDKLVKIYHSRIAYPKINSEKE